MVYKNKIKLLPHRFFSCLNIFSVFSWRKPDVFRLWERKFSWYLFPQQCLAAFRTQVPIVKLLVLQSTEAAEAVLSDWLEKARWCGFEGATAGTGSNPQPYINALHICWIIVRRQAGFCCSWLLPVCKLKYHSCSKKWPYRVTELVADKLLWFKVQYFYQRNSCNVASTEASQS